LQLFGVRDCNQELCVLKKRKPDFVCVLAKLLGYLEYDCKPGGSVKNAKSYLVILNMIASLCSVWLQNLLVYFCDCKKEKEKLNQCVIATLWRAWLQPGVMCVAKRETWLCLCACKATWLFRKWLQAWVVSDWKKLKCVIAKICWFISVIAKKKKKNWTSVWLELFGVCDCNQELCVLQKRNLTLSVCLQSYLVI
jgi:hypothetical protein